MTASLSRVRQALQMALEQIDGLRAHDIWPSTIVPPAAMVRPTSIDYAESFDQATTFHFEVVLAVRYANVRGAQSELDGYLDADGLTSVATAIEADQTLSGTSDLVNVLRAHSYGDLMVSGTGYLGVVFDVDVLCR